MATYYITGVWKNNAGRITHVHLHLLNQDNTFGLGRKTTEEQVVQLINDNHAVYTLMWDYTNARWNTGARVIVVNEPYGAIIRTTRDRTVRDNLDNLIRMEGIV